MTDDWANLELNGGRLQICTGPDNGSTDDVPGPDTRHSWRRHGRIHVDCIIERINRALADPRSMICADAELEDSIPDPFPRPVKPKTTREFLRSFMTDAPDTSENNAGSITETPNDYLDDGEDAASIVRAIREREHTEYDDE